MKNAGNIANTYLPTKEQMNMKITVRVGSGASGQSTYTTSDHHVPICGPRER